MTTAPKSLNELDRLTKQHQLKELSRQKRLNRQYYVYDDSAEAGSPPLPLHEISNKDTGPYSDKTEWGSDLKINYKAKSSFRKWLCNLLLNILEC